MDALVMIFMFIYTVVLSAHIYMGKAINTINTINHT
ncbi:hypothetical protein S202_01 [Shigella phage S2_02]|uniref:Uncharacterized protein n=1 Tax=Shigella phage S2_02 TaxID=3027007 RepID=A0AAF0D0V5_9CAUD|nr:hypothetical protein S202_01 [Shigella phage S2_02]